MSGHLPLSDSVRDESNLRGLKLLAIFLPVAAVIVGEVGRAALIAPSVGNDLDHWVSAILAIAAVLGFTAMMLTGIGRAQRSIVRQNRDLRAATAVSVALQADDPLDDVIRRTLVELIEATGAAAAEVELFAHAASDGTTRTIREESAERVGLSPADRPAGAPDQVDVPLRSGTTLVGRLTIRAPGGYVTDPVEPVDPAVLEMIGHEIACAIEKRQLVLDLRRGRSQADALYDLALQVTNRQPLAGILDAVTLHAHDLLDADEATLCLSEPASAALREARVLAAEPAMADGLTCFIRTAAGPAGRAHVAGPTCPLKTARTWASVTEAPLRSSDSTLGELWVARAGSTPFDDLDRGFLAGLADLAAIAVVSADLRQRDEMATIVAERERIAREMHDSLAQVLATSHLRLRVLEGRPVVREDPLLATEITALGDLTHEAYVDVREAILGLRESSRTDRDLLGSLRVYLEKFSHQTGLAGRLETDLAGDPGLAPGAEIQVIRVIQEALTNVRKHAVATSATVRVERDDEGVCLTVVDDGRGFDQSDLDRREDGFGLHAMRERMTLVGGSLMVYSAPGEGTRVVARVPLAGGPAPAGTPVAPAARHIRDGRTESYAHPAR